MNNITNKAMGVAHSLLENGLIIPEDISIGGTDNIHFTKFYNPPLTTVKVSTEKVGERAVELILEKLNKGIPENKAIVFPAELITRKSTSSPKK